MLATLLAALLTALLTGCKQSDAPQVASGSAATARRSPASSASAAPALVGTVAQARGSLTPIAVVELFTSEGCSSCPSADRVFSKLTAREQAQPRNVLTLAFHVDYWNRLGWRDRFSDRAYSNRQRWYALEQPEPRIYTPQMIVQGTTQFVGSQQETAEAAISHSLKKPARVLVSLQLRRLADDAAKREQVQHYTIDYQVERAARLDTLSMALVQHHAVSEVLTGENAGERLEHANVVVDYAQKQVDTGRGTWRARQPLAGDEQSGLSVMAFVQDADSLEVLGGNRLDW